MLDMVIMRGVQTYEFIKMNGWSSFFKETFYRDRRAIVFEKKLAETKDQTHMLDVFGVSVIEIDEETVRTRRYEYCFTNRRLKAQHYLGEGYAGFGLVKAGEIIGEMWYCTGKAAGGHGDLPWLGIALEPGELYAFDWFVVPQERGDNLAGIFQNIALHRLYRKGFVRAFAYVWADNTPALWNTRSISRWKELRTVKTNRFLIARMNA